MLAKICHLISLNSQKLAIAQGAKKFKYRPSEQDLQVMINFHWYKQTNIRHPFNIEH